MKKDEAVGTKICYYLNVAKIIYFDFYSRIGDRLTFRIEIPDKTPYGIFARSCLAMAKDARSTFEIIDDEGCPVDPGIFPRFTPEGNALVSTYEAFRFTESYGVIFQCNVKYCLGPCQPVSSYAKSKLGLLPSQFGCNF